VSYLPLSTQYKVSIIIFYHGIGDASFREKTLTLANFLSLLLKSMGSPIKRHLSREKGISSVRKVSSSLPYLPGRSEAIVRLREGTLLGFIGATATAFLLSLLRMLLPLRQKVRYLSYEQETI
jgi:hypothetical protein